MGEDRPARSEGRRESRSLPVSRSFVVQFSPDTTPGSGVFRGRVEHIETGRSQRFSVLEDLLAFVGVVLETNETEERP
jgi:hypothetical protein